MEIVTGHRGTPHVTPYKVRDFNIGIVGAEDYVMNGGSELEAQLVSNNRIDIKDGSICMQGTHAVIPKNINDELTIENGMQGEKRIDLIVARYEKVADSGVESVNTVVLQGTPSKESPIVPGHVVGDIRNGDLKHEMPLYEVELDGINVVEVRPVFKKIVSAAEQQKMIELLNGKSIFESGTSGNWKYNKWSNGDVELWYEGILPFANKTDAGLSGIFMTIANVSLPFQIKNGVTFASLKWAYTEWCTSYLTNDNRVQIRKFSNANSAGITDQRCAIYVKGKY